MYYTAVHYFVIVIQEHLWKHGTWCHWRLLLSLDVMPCSSLDRGNVSGEYTADLGVKVAEATERSPVDGGCDGTWGILISLPSERFAWQGGHSCWDAVRVMTYCRSSLYIPYPPWADKVRKVAERECI